MLASIAPRTSLVIRIKINDVDVDELLERTNNENVLHRDRSHGVEIIIDSVDIFLNRKAIVIIGSQLIAHEADRDRADTHFERRAPRTCDARHRKGPSDVIMDGTAHRRLANALQAPGRADRHHSLRRCRRPD